MNEQEQRIAIAEFCGWKEQDHSFRTQVYSGCGTYSYDNFFWKDRTGLWCKEPPDYLHDLNAMHEAEKKLNPHNPHDSSWVIYRLELFKLCGDAVGHATADQRAEALLRTIGKWKE